MKKETKEVVAFAAAFGTTLATGSLVGLMAGWGATALVNHAFEGGLTKGQVKLLETVIGVGSWGISITVANELFPKFHSNFKDILDIFPTDPKEVNEDG